jgi:hypothetical protein
MSEGSENAFIHLSLWERSDRPCDPGEGLQPNVRLYPLTPTLSPWERERAVAAETLKRNFIVT